MILKNRTVNDLLLRNKEKLLHFTKEQRTSCDALVTISKDFFSSKPAILEDFYEKLCGMGAKLKERMDLSALDDVPVIRFGHRFKGKLSASTWAEAALKKRLVAAVDGSQLTSSSLHGLPFGFVSCGWYVNHHEGLAFEKESALKLVLPGQGAGHVPDSRVNFERTYGELEKVRELIKAMNSRSTLDHESHTQTAEKPGPPLIFFDGSLIFSFAEHLGETEKKRYRQILTKIFTDSKEHSVAVVGFVDNSLARDFTATLASFKGGKHQSKEPPGSQDIGFHVVPDSVFFDTFLDLWGDRSPIFSSLRKGLLSNSSEGEESPQILFCYLRTSGNSVPARIEFPGWIFDAGLADDMITMVLAQTVAGKGYPLALKKAHELAVIGSKDRDLILHQLFKFLKKSEIPLSASTKSLLKEN